MKILTIGPSPTLFVQSGRIHKSLIEALSVDHDVESIVSNHDVKYFLPNDFGVHSYPVNNKLVTIYPFFGQSGDVAVFTFETMKKVQPQVVISIGGHGETESIGIIKSTYGCLFKWISIIVDSGYTKLNDINVINIDIADKVFVTNTSAQKNFISQGILKTECLHFGADKLFFRKEANRSGFKVLSMSKNLNGSNLGAIVNAAADANVNLTMNLDKYDQVGDYNLESLVKETGKSELFSFSKRFVSINEGHSDIEIANLYASHDVIVDCSIESSTALTMIEGMATGCIPVGMDRGCAADIFSQIPSWCKFTVPCIEFIGVRNEKKSIINAKELSLALQKVRESVKNETWATDARRCMKGIAEKFEKELYTGFIKQIVEIVIDRQHSIAVDLF